MKQHKEILIKNSLQKAEESLSAAELNINHNFLDTAQNRIYYAIFYAVTAVAYYAEFSTSKHSQLLGWFNKNFVKDNKIFPAEMFKLYQRTYENRRKSDYEFIWKPNKENLIADFEDAEKFIETVKNYIDS